MHNWANIVLWVYIVLLFVGGLMGYLKAGSKISLLTSAAFAAVLILCDIGFIRRDFADIVLVFLLLFFAYRLTKSKKMMPNGMMAVLTLAALVLRRFHP